MVFKEILITRILGKNLESSSVKARKAEKKRLCRPYVLHEVFAFSAKYSVFFSFIIQNSLERKFQSYLNRQKSIQFPFL